MSTVQEEISELVQRVKTGRPFESLAAAKRLAEVMSNWSEEHPRVPEVVEVDEPSSTES